MIRKYLLPFTIVLLCITAPKGYSQEAVPEKEPTTDHRRGFFAGGQASTNGLGISVRYIMSPRISIIAGYENMQIERNINIYSYGVPFNAQIDYETGGIYLLGEFYYTPSLYVSAGVISNNFQPSAEGNALSSIRYGDITLPPSTIGTLQVDVEPGLKYSPYAGMGIRRFLDRKRSWSFNFETGLYYMGSPDMDLSATGLLQPTADPANGKEEYLEAQFSVYKYYPVIKAGIAVRLF